MQPQQIMVLPVLWKTCKYFVCWDKNGIAFHLLTNTFCGKTNSKGWSSFSQMLPPYSSAIPAKGMWFCLIRDHKWAPGKPPIFNFWSPWLPGLPLAGRGSVLQGPSRSAMLPEVTRASWFSERLCVCLHVCAKSNILPALSKLFSLDDMLQGLSMLKTYFQNICKPKWFQIFERPDMKVWLVNQPRSRGAPARLVEWAIPHEFTNIFKCVFLIWSRSSMFMPPPK